MIFGVFAVVESIYNAVFGASYDKIAFINSLQLESLDVIAIYLIIVFSLLFHEFGHMITAKHYDVSVPDMGLMLYCFVPCAYTNLTHLTYCKNPSKKLHVLFAGCMADMGIIGVSMTFFNLMPICLATRYFLFAVLFNMLGIMCNLIVFFKFDGYYIFQVLIGEENFKSGAINTCIIFIKKKIMSFKNRDKGVVVWSKSNEQELYVVLCFIYTMFSMLYIPILLGSGLLSFIIL